MSSSFSSSYTYRAVLFFLGLALAVSAPRALMAQDLVVEEHIVPVENKKEKNKEEDHHYPAATIRSVKIVIHDVFEEKELESFYETVNSLKINTRKDVIERELLFKEGEALDEFTLRESERKLRALGIVNNVRINPTFDGDQADVVVQVQDTWTLLPLINYSSGSGNERRSIGAAESNVAGYGKRLEFLYDENDGRTQLQGVWDDPRVWGTQNQFTAGYFDRSDGYRSLVAFGRPYRSLLDKNSWFVTADNSDTVGRLFENGDERFIYGQTRDEVEILYSPARIDLDRTVHRFIAGYNYAAFDFEEATADDFEDTEVDPDSVSHDPALLAHDRRFTGPLVGYRRIVPDFVALDYIDRFERVEDFNLGNDFSIQLGMAPEMLGSLDDALLFSLNDSDGIRLGRASFIRGEAGLATRYSSGSVEDSLMRAELKYFNNIGPKFVGERFIGNHTIASQIVFEYGDDLDNDRELLLGGDNGLRGYDAKTFTGDKRLLFNVEDRFHIADNVFKLISLGGAVFFDAGGVTDQSAGHLLSDNIYSDVGVGLRLGFPRSSGGKVFRIDFAFPLREGPDGSGRLELRVLFKGGQLFDGFLRSESVGARNAATDIGFDS